MVSTLKTSVIQEPSSGTANLTLDASGGVTVGQNLTVAGTTTFTGGSTFTGNATAAAFIPSGSTVPTNGLYRPAANTVGLATNSTNALYIDSSQNVGIGTSSPAYKLDVNSNANVNGTVVMTSPYTMRNKIINGAMVIDQRNAGASISASDNSYCLDRWYMNNFPSANGVKYTVQQNAGSVTPPAGFANYLGITSSSAYTLVATSIYKITQFIEGFNTADLAWGTANAKTITLSFWVRSSLTGTFGGALQNSAENRSYPFTYTISVANTWEQKSVTIAGDTSGTWLTTNGKGVGVHFGLGVGSTYSGTAGAWAGADYRSATGATSVVSTNGATWYVTGVQFEIGTAATPFEYRNYQQELAMCQRYFVQFGGDSSNDQVGAGQAFSATGAGATVRFPVTMRSNPTLDSFTASNWSVMNGSGGLVAATAIVLGGGQTNRNGTQLSITVASGLTAGQGSSLLANTSSAKLPFNAEL